MHALIRTPDERFSKEIAAYDAPFPDKRYEAGVHAFPSRSGLHKRPSGGIGVTVLDRRRFPRVHIESTDLSILRFECRQPEVRLDRLIDLSCGGLQVELAEGESRPLIGQLLDVTLEWGGVSRQFDASVRRIVRSGDRLRVGIEFDDPDLVGLALNDLSGTSPDPDRTAVLRRRLKLGMPASN